MQEKPTHLGPRYGSQWLAPEMAKAYAARRPYLNQVANILMTLATPGPILELGAGTGDLTHLLAGRGGIVTAVELSEAMVAIGRERAPEVDWVRSDFESAPLAGLYGLAVAAESMHWLEWAIAIPKISRLLSDDSVLALVCRREVPPEWWPDVIALIAKFSTCQDWAPYDIVDELTQRGMFREVGRKTVGPVESLDSPGAFLERTHSRNGFSRAEMTAQDALAFDDGIRRILEPRLADGRFRLDYAVDIIWGHPTPMKSSALMSGSSAGT